jgi:CheY-like chemotaxis protein
MMPVMNGAQLIERLRSAPSTKGIPIVAITGDAHLAGGADVIIHKPFNLDNLISTVERLLNGSPGDAL